MHALLCFSASHLKHLHPESHEYDQSVILHKHHALSLLQAEITEIVSSPTPAMNEAAYGTGAILAVQSIGSFKLDDSSADYPTDLNWILLMTGFKSLVVKMWDVMPESIFFPAMRDSTGDIPVATPDEERAYLRKFNLDTLQSTLPPSYSNHITQLACILAPFFPLDFYARPPSASLPPNSFGSGMPWALQQLFRWIVTLPDSFVPRAKEGDPAVLTILWWAFALFREVHACRSAPLWWIERMAKEGVEDMETACRGLGVENEMQI
jgi:Fungal specific transcription factor domain